MKCILFILMPFYLTASCYECDFFKQHVEIRINEITEKLYEMETDDCTYGNYQYLHGRLKELLEMKEYFIE